MKTFRLFNGTVGVASLNEHVLEKYGRTISKSQKEGKIISPPVAISELLNLEDENEYYAACLRAIREAAVSQVDCKNKEVKNWFANGYFPDGDLIGHLQEQVNYYVGCGNAFFLKVRDAAGHWSGLQKLFPHEISIMEGYQNNLPAPSYIQTRNSKKQTFKNADVLHLKKNSHKSLFWGVPGLSIVQNIKILSEIKTYDYNSFKNGLMIDYFIIVNGGSLQGNEIRDDNDQIIEQDAYKFLEEQLRAARGNLKSHSAILLETGSPDVKIELIPLRQGREGGFLDLKKDLRDGIFNYFGIPKRMVGQETTGKMGGDNNSDITIFYYFTIKSIQQRLATMLARSFKDELNIAVDPQDFNFGDPTELFLNEDQKLFKDKIKED